MNIFPSGHSSKAIKNPNSIASTNTSIVILDLLKDVLHMDMQELQKKGVHECNTA